MKVYSTDLFPNRNFLKRSPPRKTSGAIFRLLFSWISLLFFTIACQTSSQFRLEADKAAKTIIQEKQQQALGKNAPFSIERPSDVLRRRLLMIQKLPTSSKASFGTDMLEKIDHWPEEGYPEKKLPTDSLVSPTGHVPLLLSLFQALQVGARNSFDYQTKKEDVFRAALDLDLERNGFRSIFSGQIDGLISTDRKSRETVTGTETTGSTDWSRKLKSGVEFSAALAVDLVKLLTQDRSSSLGIVGDASITIPLLRGAGKHIVTELLTQAERNVVYAIWEFERFKKIFAVNIASEYLQVLRQLNEVENAAENYRNLIASTRRSRRMADAGRVSEVQVDQSRQNELRARNRWIRAEESYKNQLDGFKGSLGLPPDADIVLDRDDLDRLVALSSKSITEISREETLGDNKGVPPADESVELVKPGRENAGPLEMDAFHAVELGLKNRLDLRVSEGRVYDAQRKIVVLADALRAEVTLFGHAELGESRSIATAGLDNARLRPDRGIYSSLLTIDLPFERTAERNAYRKGFITLENSVREIQKLEDDVKLSIRRRLRDMYEARESRKIQARAQVIAEKRVKSTNLFFEAGRIPIRDVLEAQEALINARNGLISEVVAYRIAELEFQRDTGVLKIDENGLWKEYAPEKGGIEHGG